jgi:hypothetical protein
MIRTLQYFIILVASLYVRGAPPIPSISYDVDSKIPKIVDTFIFDGEPAALFRLQYLKDVVDLFVIAEMKVTFSGLVKKGYQLNRYNDTFTELEKSGKLLRIYIEDFPYKDQYHWKIGRFYYETHSMLDIILNSVKEVRMLPFARERYLRDISTPYIFDYMKGHPFILMVCDADEIPSRNFVTKLRHLYYALDSPVRMDMLTFYYSFKWVKPERWSRAFVVNDRNITRNTSVNDIRFFNEKLPMFKQTGWHCSYCSTPAKIAQKIRHFSHVEFNKPQFVNESWIQHCREHGVDIFNRPWDNEVLSKYNGSEGYPTGVDKCRSRVSGCRFLDIPEGP